MLIASILLHLFFLFSYSVSYFVSLLFVFAIDIFYISPCLRTIASGAALQTAYNNLRWNVEINPGPKSNSCENLSVSN